MEIVVHTLNAFTESVNGGNPAGLVLDADQLSDKQMLTIAQKVGFSETAFFISAYNSDYNLRYFTPAGEADVCGHATVAAFYYLLKEKTINPGKFSLRTKAGLLEVDCFSDSSIFLQQNLPFFGNVLDKAIVSDALGITGDKISANLPVQIVSTGLPDVIVPVVNLKTMQTLLPNMTKISKICEENKAGSFHVFSIETLFNKSAHCRDFAPLYAIPEEAATGTASAALACYLYKFGLIKNSTKLIFEQGYEMKRPSEITVNIDIETNSLKYIFVGGRAVYTGKIIIEIEEL